MSKSFSYSILTYKHSLFLGEVLNVGVLLIFPEENLVEFHYPKKINRIKNLYSNFNEPLIKDYLKAFESKSKTLNRHLDKYVFGYNEIINDHLIIDDASALQFDDFRTGIYYSSPDEVIERYVNLVLGEYNSETVRVKSRITDETLVENVKSKVAQLNPNAKRFIKFDHKRILRNKHVAFRSDFYWKNGEINYAKAVSFDLKTESTIVDKSILLNGKLRQLEKTEYKNSHIDFIIQEPSNLQFKDTFEEAKAILIENNIEKRIFTDWTEYSKLVAKDIKAL